ncbi:hypothetical protein Godav_011957 [Gossypium davidsonii]|uniref:Uncharacterized protein n=1 Tax=Gossypium davidsonii TaxID=34287 RepID=A0A7J8RBQ7_GOSDV|nr:hypothetical protein [Gossypium davidsonii]
MSSGSYGSRQQLGRDDQLYSRCGLSERREKCAIYLAVCLDAYVDAENHFYCILPLVNSLQIHVMDMDAIFEVFGHLITEDEMNILYAEDIANDHAYRDGQLEEVALRHLRAEDGRTIITKNISETLRAVYWVRSLLSGSAIKIKSEREQQQQQG